MATRRSGSWLVRKKPQMRHRYRWIPGNGPFNSISRRKGFMRSVLYLLVNSRPSLAIRWWSSWFKTWATTCQLPFSWLVMPWLSEPCGPFRSTKSQFLIASVSFPSMIHRLLSMSFLPFLQWPSIQKKWVSKPFKCSGKPFKGVNQVFPIWSN